MALAARLPQPCIATQPQHQPAQLDPVCLCQLAGAALDPRQTAMRPCLQDSRQPSSRCWPVRSLQLRSGGSSSQCGPVVRGEPWWNDYGNDQHLASTGGPVAVLGQQRKLSVMQVTGDGRVYGRAAGRGGHDGLS
jgi:hypothetical protein